MRHEGRKCSEADHVGKRVELFAKVGICSQKPCRKSVAEVAYGSCQHQVESHVKLAFECEYHTHESAEQIHGCDCVGNMLDDIHCCLLFDAELLCNVLRKGILVNNDVQSLVADESVGSIPYALVLSGIAP